MSLSLSSVVSARRRFDHCRAVLFDGWRLAHVFFVLLACSPIAAIFVIGLGGGEDSDLWGHLWATVLPRYAMNSAILMVSVSAIAVSIGVPAAWLVSRYDFYGRRFFEWGLLLPAAMPAYIVAYVYTDVFSEGFSSSSLLGSSFAFGLGRFGFFEVRSLLGASLVMGVVFYPYVYMLARQSFMLTSAAMYESAALLGRGVFRHAALPLARPAIASGAALTAMETLADFGAVELFAVETLTLGIYNVWLGMGDLGSAARLSAMGVFLVLALLFLERRLRSHRGYRMQSGSLSGSRRLRAFGLRGLLYMSLCFLPIFFGFLFPSLILLSFVLRGYAASFFADGGRVVFHSLQLAGLSSAIVMSIAGLWAIVSTYRGGAVLRRLALAGSCGYAFPGTILAVGVVMFAGVVDAGYDGLRRAMGLSGGALLSGGIFLAAMACSVRFMAIGYGAALSGVQRFPSDMMNACRSLGCRFGVGVRRVILPLSSPWLAVGGVLVFVETMKELPMTLLLRPFDYETLAAFVYQYAKDERLEEASGAALMIVAAGLAPVIVLNRALRAFAQGPGVFFSGDGGRSAMEGKIVD